MKAVMRNRFRRIFLLGLLALMLGQTAFAMAGAKARVVRVGYVPDYAIITNPNSTDHKGYGYDYLMEVAKYTGWRYEFVPCQWEEGVQLLEEGEIDLFGPAERTPERETQFCFTASPLGQEYGGLFISKNDDRYAYGDVESFDGMRVATVEGSIFVEQFEEYCQKMGIQTILVPTEVEDFLAGLTTGEFDGGLFGSMANLPGTVLADKISVNPVFFITSKTNQALCNQLDEAMAEIELEDFRFQSRLYSEYYGGNPATTPAFTKEEKAFIAEHPMIRVTSDPDWSPIEYYDRSDGRYRGINVDVLRELGKICGITFQFVPVENYDQCRQLIQENQVSLILPHTEPASELGVVYTEPFFQVSTSLVGRREIDIMRTLRVGVSNIQSQPAQALLKKYPHMEFIPYSSTVALLEALRTGKEDFIFVNAYVYDEAVRSVDGSTYRALPTEITYPLRIGVDLDADPLLLSILNKAIGRLPVGTVNSIVFANTVNRAYKVPFVRMLWDNIYAIAAILLLAFSLVVTCIVMVSRRGRKQVEAIAYVDELTGLATQAKFQKDAHKVLGESGTHQFLMASLDVDNFKYINDVFGYDMGNQILKTMADRFRLFPEVYRLVCRSGADTFLFLVEYRAKEEIVAQFSEMLADCEHVRELLPPNYNFVLSAGLYVLSDSGEAFASCCDKANIARKAVKGSHLSALKEYTEEMDRQMSWKKEVTLSMEGALEHGDFKVYLQPKYSFMDEDLAGAEALVRWDHPKDGLLSPMDFIPLFEQNGFILKLDMFMFQQVCILLRRWLDMGLNTPPVSVNFSRRHLVNHSMVEDLVRVREAYQIPPGLLEIELTESIVLDNEERLVGVMKKLKEQGFEISIDDFGSGYSSLNLLTNLPVDVLKLDKGFLDKMSDTDNSRLIVEQVIGLAKKLNLSTVAEGVETIEQVAILRQMGCDLAQGYYYARPMPAWDYEILLMAEDRVFSRGAKAALQQVPAVEK